MTSQETSGTKSKLQVMSYAKEEEIIKQRLHVDESRLRRLLRKLTTVLGAQDAESLSIARMSLAEEVESLQGNLSRLAYGARSTCEVEMRLYQRELIEIEEQRETTRARIEMLKRRLSEVKLERQNKSQYDDVAKRIVKLPSRSELAESLDKLKEQLEQVHAENAKYASMSRSAAARMSTLADSIDTLHNDIGYEVGERERREVERGDGEAEADPTDPPSRSGERAGEAEADPAPPSSRATEADGEAEADPVEPPSRAGEREEGEEVEQRLSPSPTGSGSRTPQLPSWDSDPPVIALNPSAPVFQPNRDPPTTTDTPRKSRPKRGSSALNGSDEEGELQDTSVRKTSASNTPIKNSNDDTPRKRQRHQE